MQTWLRRGGGLLAAALVTLFFASLAHSLSVQAGLVALGTEISLGTRIGAILRDLAGLAPAFGIVIFIALLIGFVVAGLVRRYWPVTPWIAFPLAGFAAIATALLAMRLQFTFSPIAGAREMPGFLAISAAGALGGLAFAFITRRRPN